MGARLMRLHASKLVRKQTCRSIKAAPSCPTQRPQPVQNMLCVHLAMRCNRIDVLCKFGFFCAVQINLGSVPTQSGTLRK